MTNKNTGNLYQQCYVFKINEVKIKYYLILKALYFMKTIIILIKL